jgi:hypothetical protein
LPRVVTRAAAAPSLSGEALPAVTTPLAEKAGRSEARPSSVVSPRGSSSTLNSVFSRLPSMPAL